MYARCSWKLLSLPGAALWLALLLGAGSSVVAAGDDDRGRIAAVLDDFHDAAATADRDRYLGHFAPNGVFMGTDDWERWPLEEFTAYVDERFSNGGGWHYEPQGRHLDFSPDGNTAWFDEIMVSPRWGRFRGTGVLLQLSGKWKLAHYSLTALVPNERFEDVSRMTRAGYEARKESGSKE